MRRYDWGIWGIRHIGRFECRASESVSGNRSCDESVLRTAYQYISRMATYPLKTPQLCCSTAATLNADKRLDVDVLRSAVTVSLELLVVRYRLVHTMEDTILRTESLTISATNSRMTLAVEYPEGESSQAMCEGRYTRSLVTKQRVKTGRG